MKIYSFTTVKDEADIIESFVRYNMNILDGMVISDNGSNDNTLDILYKLKNEGYNIDIIIDKSRTFDQYLKRNELLQYTNKDISLALNGLRFHARESGISHHKYYILDKILKYGSIPLKELYEFSKYYDVVDAKSDNIYKRFNKRINGK